MNTTDILVFIINILVLICLFLLFIWVGQIIKDHITNKYNKIQNNMEQENIIIEPKLHITGMFCLHYADNGEEAWIDEDEFDSVKEYPDKTYVRYYTGYEDCPYEGLYVKETKEEIYALVKQTREKLSQAYNKYEITEIQ
jgi:hypothetical protein